MRVLGRRGVARRLFAVLTIAVFLHSCARKNEEGFLSLLPPDAYAVAWVDRPSLFIPRFDSFLRSALPAFLQGDTSGTGALLSAFAPTRGLWEALIPLMDGEKPCGVFGAPGAGGEEAYALVFSAIDQAAAVAWISANLGERGLAVLDSSGDYLLFGKADSGLSFSEVGGSFAGQKNEGGLKAILSPSSALAERLQRTLPLFPDSTSLELSLDLDDAFARLILRARLRPPEPSGGSPLTAASTAAGLPSWLEGWQGMERHAGRDWTFSRFSAEAFAQWILAASRAEIPPSGAEPPFARAEGDIAFYRRITGDSLEARLLLPAAGLSRALASLGTEGISGVASFLSTGKPRPRALASAGTPRALSRPSRASATNPAMSRYYCSLSSWDQATLDELMRALQSVPLPGDLRVDAPELRGAMTGIDRDPFAP